MQPVNDKPMQIPELYPPAEQSLAEFRYHTFFIGLFGESHNLLRLTLNYTLLQMIQNQKLVHFSASSQKSQES